MGVNLQAQRPLLFAFPQGLNSNEAQISSVCEICVNSRVLRPGIRGVLIKSRESKTLVDGISVRSALPCAFLLHHSSGPRLRIGRVSCTTRSEQEGASVSENTEKEIRRQSQEDLKIVDSSFHQFPSENLKESPPEYEPNTPSSIRTVALWVCAAVAFGVAIGFKDGIGKASEFFAGYILEQSLSVDNLFVFVLIFRYFKVPVAYQSRVLSYGIAGAIFFRASMILLGTATLQRFEAVNILFAVILLYSSYKLFSGEEEETDLSDNVIVKTCQKFIPITNGYDGNRFITMQDGVKKVDSIPAVFGITRDPVIVFSSNLFAIVGLRSLYMLISRSMSELEYLQPSIGVVLGFIGSKMILDFFGYHISTEASLGFVATALSAGVILSLIKKSD
ncbi:thylakoid membrane protein TERC, chloroplastic isoform X2 [Amborella trichopoda]|uniref:thylakoid membrane protein TERC, chloroplastic isoform X2 n=1 Tax=Amborella trichopoda TaxID=13333 RepID=UPI0005D2D4C9|nr:thylakoid membrane protein TERC, chloroplastic isoform X2 [Amborella trichopoda]|eukprot:XP_011627205.1 thylakoid membrane protein TERC, chloroplastic isoform X2 [Amborella trichopoda]